MITIGSAGDYAEKLRACHVIVDQDERRAIIRERRRRGSRPRPGLTLVEDEGLVTENAGLTEWPVPLLGRFDAAFLEVPPEVIQLTARVNQKYFVCRDARRQARQRLHLHREHRRGRWRRGDRRGQPQGAGGAAVGRAFFWEQDLKVPLEEQAKKLEQIIFHEKLGTVADKVERVAKLRALAGRAKRHRRPNRGRATLADMAERAARLAKADLVTGMVGEFPELQGLMGGYYARAAGRARRGRRRDPRSLQAGRAGRRRADRAGDGGGVAGGQAGYACCASFRSVRSRPDRRIRLRCGGPRSA